MGSYAYLTAGIITARQAELLQMQCAVENKKIYHNNDYLERR